MRGEDDVRVLALLHCAEPPIDSNGQQSALIAQSFVDELDNDSARSASDGSLPDYAAQDRPKVSKSNHGRTPVIWCATEDKRRGSVEDVELHEGGPIEKAGPLR